MPAATARDGSSPPAPETPAGKAFGRSFWMLNCIEAFERLAYFGIRSVVPLYIMQATEPGGLHLTAMHKGTIYAWWAIFQSFLPIVTGGLADRYGYKRVLFLAIAMNALGYAMMANFHGYLGFFAGILVLATGTAFFKPALQGSLAQNLTRKNSSLGWGIFYWVVNVGAVTAPIIATAILGRPHSAEGWRDLFYACALFTLCNLFLLFTFKDVPSGASKTESTLQVLARTVANILDPRLLAWLAIMSCFWLMMYQLWDLHPNFITDWVDSSMLAREWLPAGWLEYSDSGRPGVQQQMLLNLNAAMIVLLMVPVSWAARKMRTLSAMLIGMCIATAGVAVAGLTGNGAVLLLGIVFFSLGEMWTGPKKNEYLGLIAPPGKKALYLGYVNIPVGVGLFFGSYLAGFVYDNYGEKATLALKRLGEEPGLVARAVRAVDWSDSLDRIPGLLGIERREALGLAASELGLEPDAAARRLEELFRHDRGHLVNLCLQEIALHPEWNARAAERLAPVLSAAGERGLGAENAARHLEHLPMALGLTRGSAFEVARQLANQALPPAEALDDEAVGERLRRRFSGNAETLANLALEFLAQGTGRMAAAAAALTFVNPVKEIPATLGIGRQKSFAGLAGALGADDAAVDRALEALGAPPAGPDLRPLAHLAGLAHQRFNAVARRDWNRDKAFLAELIESDPAARGLVAEALPLPPDEVYVRLAGNLGLIQRALAVKAWAGVPAQAGKLLGLNPFEARGLVGVDLADSAKAATRLLWERYDPHLRVWIPFVAIGLAAILALAIFGRMARKWSDMDA